MKDCFWGERTPMAGSRWLHRKAVLPLSAQACGFCWKLKVQFRSLSIHLFQPFCFPFWLSVWLARYLRTRLTEMLKSSQYFCFLITEGLLREFAIFRTEERERRLFVSSGTILFIISSCLVFELCYCFFLKNAIAVSEWSTFCLWETEKLSLSSFITSRQILFGVSDILFIHQLSLHLAALISTELIRLIRTMQNIC